MEGAPPGTFPVLAKRKADSGIVDTTEKIGKVIQTTHAVVSTDGKSMRATTKGTDAQGKKFESVEVWDKQ